MSPVLVTIRRGSVFRRSHVLERRVEHEIDLARAECGQPRRVGADAGEGHVVEVARALVGPAPPGVVALERDAHVGLVALEPERAGAHRIAHREHLLLAVEVLRLLGAVLRAPGLAHHRHVLQLLGPHRVGRGEHEVDRLLVDLLDGGQAAQRERALRRRPLRALDREDRVVGGERRAVVELDAAAQLEAPGRRVDHLPRLGQRRLELELLVARDQAVVDLERHARVVQQRQRVRVHRLRVERAGDAQRGGVGGEAERGERAEQQCGARGITVHGGALPVWSWQAA